MSRPLITEEHDANIRREDQQAALKNNLLYQEYLRVKSNVDKEKIQLDAIQEVIDSNDFKNPTDALRQAYENEEKQRIKKMSRKL